VAQAVAEAVAEYRHSSQPCGRKMDMAICTTVPLLCCSLPPDEALSDSGRWRLLLSVAASPLFSLSLPAVLLGLHALHDSSDNLN